MSLVTCNNNNNNNNKDGKSKKRIMETSSVNQDEQNVLRQLRFMLNAFGPMPTACFVRKVFSGLKWDQSFASELEKLQRLLQLYWKTDYLPPLIVTSSVETGSTLEQDCLLVVVPNTHTKEIHMGLGRRFCVLGFDKFFPSETLCGGIKSFAVSFCPEFRLSKESFLLMTPSYAGETEYFYSPFYLASDEKKKISHSIGDNVSLQKQEPMTPCPLSEKKTADTSLSEEAQAKNKEIDKKSVTAIAASNEQKKQAVLDLPATAANEKVDLPAAVADRKVDSPAAAVNVKVDFGMTILLIQLAALLSTMYLYHVERNEYLSLSGFVLVTTGQLLSLMLFNCEELPFIFFYLTNGLRMLFISAYALFSWNEFGHWLMIVDAFLSLEASCELLTNLVALVRPFYSVQQFRSLEEVCNYHGTKPANRYRACLLLSLMITLLFPCWYGANAQETNFEIVYKFVVFALAQSVQLYCAENLWVQSLDRQFLTSTLFSLFLLIVSVGCAVLSTSMGELFLYAAVFNVLCAIIITFSRFVTNC